MAQKDQSIWYFGDKAGVNFSSGTPVITSGHSMTSQAASASMADELGNLLFYTDGLNVWNKNHQLMWNGTGLKGNPASNQSVIIVPKPVNRNRYYIFTTDSRNGSQSNALRYSEVDMSLENGLGAVISKNNLLLENVAEKITAVFHDDNQNFWLLSHKWDSKEFCSYLITKSGIAVNPVISAIGKEYKGSLTTGRGSFRTGGSPHCLVVTLPDLGIFDLLHFDNITGKIGQRYFNLGSESARAAYASPALDGYRLFTTSVSGTEIYEYDLEFFHILPLSEKGVINSARLIGRESGAGELVSGFNEMIYVQKTNSSYLGYIQTPGNFFKFSEPSKYTGNGLTLGQAKAIHGLPNFISTGFFYSPKSLGGIIGGNNGCIKNGANFQLRATQSVDSVVWDFGDPESGKSNISRDLYPTHQFTKGVKLYFPVKAKAFIKGMVKDFESSYNPRPSYLAISDTAVCFASNTKHTFKLRATNQEQIIKWQDGTSGSFFSITKPGTYWYELSLTYDKSCTVRDSFEVKALPMPNVFLGKDTTICTGETLLLQAKNPGSRYLWQDGSQNATYLVSTPGNYSVSVINDFGCRAIDSIKVYYLDPPAIKLGNDTTICAGTDFILKSDLPGVSYKWQDGSTGSSLKVNKAGTYWVDASIDVCTARDSIIIKERDGCLDNFFVPNIITPNGDGSNDQFTISGLSKNTYCQLEIFNRYGQSVFKNLNYDNKWSGDGLTPGVYYYLLQFDKRKIKGFVEIIR